MFSYYAMLVMVGSTYIFRCSKHIQRHARSSKLRLFQLVSLAVVAIDLIFASEIRGTGILLWNDLFVCNSHMRIVGKVSEACL